MKYFADNKDSLIPVYLPNTLPEFMEQLEEIMAYSQKRFLCLLQYYDPLPILKIKYLACLPKRFNLNMRNYLLAKIKLKT